MRKIKEYLKQSELYSSIFKSMLGRFAIYGANLLSIVVLSRLFSPSDFGVLSAVVVIYSFLQIFVESGFGPAIINLKSLSEEDRNGIFTVTLLSGLFGSCLLFFSSQWLEKFYGIPGVSIAVQYIATGTIFFGGQIYLNATLVRDKKFYHIGRAGSIAEIIGLLCTLLCYGILPPLHALCIKNTIVPLCNFIILYNYSIITEFGKPKIGLKVIAITCLIKFSIFQMGFNFINYFSRNFDSIIVGKYLGAISLALYDKSYILMRYPLLLLTYSMNPAIQAVMTKKNNDASFVEINQRDIIRKLFFISIPISVGILLLSYNLVYFLFGDQWLESSKYLQILSLSIPTQVVLSTSGAFFQSMNKTNILFLSGCISALLMVGSVIYSVVFYKDLFLLCILVVISLKISFFVNYFIMYSVCFKIPYTFFLTTLRTPIIANATIIIVGLIYINYIN